jgi:hypothetical protein
MDAGSVIGVGFFLREIEILGLPIGLGTQQTDIIAENDAHRVSRENNIIV